MNSDDFKNLKKVIDGSGFPLQVKLEDMINNSMNWFVEGREVFWKNTYNDGFIDIIASHRRIPLKIFIEAKKTSGGEWVFLSQENDKRKAKQAIVLTVKSKNTQFEWDEIALPFYTEHFSFCAVTGQKNSSNPLLERIGSELIMSMEGFFKNLDSKSIIWSTEKNNAFPQFPTAISVIVTNTTLFKCYYNPDSVDLSKGVISENVDFKKVSYLAFTKPFWSEIGRSNIRQSNISKYLINEQQDRTIFIVNTSSLQSFLTDLDPFRA